MNLFYKYLFLYYDLYLLEHTHKWKSQTCWLHYKSRMSVLFRPFFYFPQCMYLSLLLSLYVINMSETFIYVWMFISWFWFVSTRTLLICWAILVTTTISHTKYFLNIVRREKIIKSKNTKLQKIKWGSVLLF
jgi:hypothetical protein